MKKLFIILCIICLAALVAAPAAWSSGNFACKCKGTKEWVLFVPTYGDCGNGFASGSKGDIHKNITADGLDSYIPPGMQAGVKHGSECGYYTQSGWNCGKMQGSSAPACVND